MAVVAPARHSCDCEAGGGPADTTAGWIPAMMGDMPDGPRPPDVTFDDAAAAEAISELGAARRLIVETEGARATATTTAQADFTGAYASDFTAGSSGLDAEATALLDGINTLRSAIEDAVADAAAQRTIVTAAQAEWDAQDAAERELRRQYPNIPV